MSEERKLSRDQLNKLSKIREYYSSIFKTILEYLKTNDPNLISEIEQLLSRNRGYTKYIPFCHILPKIRVQSLYYTVLIPTDINHKIRTPYLAACSSPILLENKSVYIVHDHIPICNLKSLLVFLDKKLHFGKSSATARISEIKDDTYLVRIQRPLDVCDLVACPDMGFISSLPCVIRERIEKHKLQYVYEKL